MKPRPDRDAHDALAAADEKTNESTRPAALHGRDPWHALAALTPARIALGHVGHAQRTATALALRAARAAACDAVRVPWDLGAFAAALEPLGSSVIVVATRAADREAFLRRPELGRQLSDASLAALLAEAGAFDLVIVVSDGLSGQAVATHGGPLVKALVHALRAAGLTLAPIILVPNAGVGASDVIGAALGARVALCIAGECPGLSGADGLAIQVTYGPRRGRQGAERNGVANIRSPDGLDHASATHIAAWLVCEALRIGASGLRLKDQHPLGPPSAHGLVRPA